jgi:HK97 family phage portal protein
VGFWRDLGRRLSGRERRYNGYSANFSNPPIPPPGAGGASFSSIDLRRAEASLQSAAVWSSTNLVATVLANLPLDTYRRQPDGTAQPIDNPPLVDDPGGEGYGAADWLYQYLMCRQLRGNVVGQLLGADRATGRPTQIVLYHPDEAYGWRDYQGVRHWTVAGRELNAAEMATLFHRRAYPMPGCVMGMSPVAYHFATIGQNVAATRFGLQFFLDSGHPSYVYRNSLEEIDQTKAAAVKERVMATTYGRREPLVMGKGWEKPEPLQVSPEDSQMLATQGYSAADCCRLFGPGLAEVLGYETGGSLTYSTRVDRATDLLTFTFDPHLTDLERMFTALLPPREFVRFNRSALLRMTTMERWRVYLMQLATKARVINEVRDDEDWAPVPWGDEPVEVAPIPAGAGADDGKTKEPPR